MVYMAQPQGFVDASRPRHVCLLQKALYGLKQAPRAWFSKLSSALIADGFSQCVSDTSLFVYSRDSVMCYVLVYVDDIIITGSSPDFVTRLIERLHSRFALKDLGQLSYFLGVLATFSDDVLHLSQQRYLLDLLQRTGLAQCRPLSTPVASGRQLSRHTGIPLPDATLYRSTVGALQYLVLTRPEIAYAVSKVSQFLQTPTDRHWEAVKRILRYLKGTLTCGLSIRRSSSMDIHAYSDADWAGCPDDRRSTTGYCVFLGSNLISWSSKKQHTVARSSTEAEYRALAHTAAELRWIMSILQELHVVLSCPPTVWCDNIGATYLAANPVFHQRTKHLEIDLHFVRDMVLSRILRICYVSTVSQIADV
ncbi:putative RNA-directed DNA polymerase [Helianthus annuus]|nr:putative RNA-directed DNA polymerase [Helianthus annuus]